MNRIPSFPCRFVPCGFLFILPSSSDLCLPMKSADVVTCFTQLGLLPCSSHRSEDDDLMMIDHRYDNSPQPFLINMSINMSINCLWACLRSELFLMSTPLHLQMHSLSYSSTPHALLSRSRLLWTVSSFWGCAALSLPPHLHPLVLNIELSWLISMPSNSTHLLFLPYFIPGNLGPCSIKYKPIVLSCALPIRNHRKHRLILFHFLNSTKTPHLTFSFSPSLSSPHKNEKRKNHPTSSTSDLWFSHLIFNPIFSRLHPQSSHVPLSGIFPFSPSA